MKKESTKINPLRIFVLLFLILVFIFSGIKIWNTLNTPNITEAEPETISKTIIRNDTAYFPRQDITVFMLLGIDEFGPVKASDSYNNKGEADMIALIVFDHTEKNYDIVVVNRDTMMDVPVLGINGHKAGTAYQQVALSHTYGSGLEDSCENTEEAISNFFYGLNIDYYMSINMDAISILTDAVGGVEVGQTLPKNGRSLQKQRLRCSVDVDAQLEIGNDRESVTGIGIAADTVRQRHRFEHATVYHDLGNRGMPNITGSPLIGAHSDRLVIGVDRNEVIGCRGLVVVVRTSNKISRTEQALFGIGQVVVAGDNLTVVGNFSLRRRLGIVRCKDRQPKNGMDRRQHDRQGNHPRLGALEKAGIVVHYSFSS